MRIAETLDEKEQNHWLLQAEWMKTALLPTSEERRDGYTKIMEQAKKSHEEYALASMAEYGLWREQKAAEKQSASTGEKATDTEK